MEKPSLIFITGGVRSGKSSFAEKIAINNAMKTNGALHYIATGVPSDQEMKKRIVLHQKEREESGLFWQTWEQSTNIGVLSSSFKQQDILLLDCLTTLLNNELFFSNQDWDESFLKGIFERILTGIMDIRKQCGQLIIVSNEVLHDPLYESDLLFNYGRLLGGLHQQIVRMANVAYLVEAGVPIVMKEGFNTVAGGEVI